MKTYSRFWNKTYDWLKCIALIMKYVYRDKIHISILDEEGLCYLEFVKKVF
jgi:hypothetical protein